MRPPICEICGEDIEGEEGDLVSFARSPSDENWHEQARKDPGFVGHPPEMEWFCGKHIARARELSHLTRAEAMQLLTKEFGQ